jgi:hypothetical protein
MKTRMLALLGALLALVVNGCSKTEDTAPENRIFGDPPVIQSVDFVGSQQTIVCDVSNFVRVQLCAAFGFAPSTYTMQQPTINLSLSYTDILMKVRATDPNSTPTTNDVLLVGASYVHDSKETTLLVFDDGSQLQFPQLQAVPEPTDCSDYHFDATSDFCPTFGFPDTMPCKNVTYQLASNDATASDGEYSRGYAFATFQGTFAPAAIDCFAQELKRPTVSTEGVVNHELGFKIEAVDRSGNIATWPTSPSVLVTGSDLVCSGDDCACCLLSSANALVDCRGKDGFFGAPGTGYEGGFCHLL